MANWTRRKVLEVGIGAGLGLGGIAAFRAWSELQRGAGFDEVVRAIIETPEPDIIRVTARLLDSGTPPETLLFAAFHAPILSAGDRGDVHAMMVIDAIRALPWADDPQTRLIPVFWAVANASAWSRRDTAPPLKLPILKAKSALEARNAFLAAVDDNNSDLAEATIVALYLMGGLDATRDAVAVAGCGSFSDVHRMIYAVQSHRVLGIMGQDRAVEVLRSVAHHLAISAVPIDSNADAQANRTLLEAHPTIALTGRLDDGATRHILSALRDPGADPLGALIMDVLGSGISPASVWDAAALAAIECAIDNPAASGMGVHTTTLTAALRAAFETASDPADKLWIMLQGTAWISRVYKSSARLDAASPTPDPDHDMLTRWHRGLAQTTSPQALALQKAAALGQIAVGSSDTHDFKFPAAVLDLAALTSPNWRPRIDAALALARPLRQNTPWSRLEEVKAALQA